MAARRRASTIRLWQASAEAERAALIAALDGRRVAPGPAGAPARGRRDVLPTGRNLFTADPRTLPTPTAMELGRLAADEVVRAHLQTHGEMPRAVVIDLWGSATLRTGGEEIAQGLALMGCRPIWDHASGRVTGVEVLPTAAIGRARVDVTWRISGLFRDLFPAQIALIDAAVQAVAARDETDDENPLRGARTAQRRRSSRPHLRHRARRLWRRRRGFARPRRRQRRRSARPISPPPRMLMAAPTAKPARRPALSRSASPTPTCSCIPATIPAAIFSKAPRTPPSSAALPRRPKLLGRSADLVMLDMTDPQRPRARALSAALARIVRARAVNPRFIAGQMRHGPRGAAELAETVDRLVAFAETTDAVAERIVRSFARRLCRRSRGARLSAARKSRSRRGDRRAARCRAAPRLVASAPQRRRCRLCGAARGGRRHDRSRDRTCRSAAAPAPACRRRCRPATACWCGCIRSALSRSPPSRDCARRRARMATASSKSPRAAASRCAA